MDPQTLLLLSGIAQTAIGLINDYANGKEVTVEELNVKMLRMNSVMDELRDAIDAYPADVPKP